MYSLSASAARTEMSTKSSIWDQDIRSSKNGEWLKIVDNDGDGIAEYVFLTEYTLDKAVS